MNETPETIEYRGFTISPAETGTNFKITKGDGVWGFAMTQELAKQAIDAYRSGENLESSDGL